MKTKQTLLYVYILHSLVRVAAADLLSENLPETKSKHCKLLNDTVVCVGHPPSSITANIRRIVISEFQDIHQYALMSFSIDALKNVEGLYLTCPPEKIKVRFLTLQSETFRNFTNLNVLKFSCHSLASIKDDALSGLINLRELDLSECSRLRIDDLTKVFNRCNLPLLERLVLRRISLFLTTIIFFSNDFFYSLKEKPIKHLDVSGTKFGQMHDTSFLQHLSHLKEFNASEGGFIAINLLKLYWTDYNQLLNLETLDISYPTITDSFIDPSNRRYLDIRLTPGEYFIQNFTTLHVNGFVRTTNVENTRIHGLDLGNRLCALFDIPSVNITLSTFCLLKENDVIYLENLSLVDNRLEHIDKSLTSFTHYIRFIDLSKNLLYRMELNEVETSLMNASELVEIRLAYNHLSFIPQRMFAYNQNLQILDLSHNNLESLSFDVDHLYKLAILKLGHNKLVTLEESFISKLSNLIRHRSKIEFNKKGEGKSVIRLELFSNPLVCSCENKNFIEWLRRSEEAKCDNVCGVSCQALSFRRNMPSQLEFECNRPYIISGSIAAAATVVVIVSIIVLVCIRRRRQNRKEKHLLQIIQMYQVKNTLREYPVFLSYSSADETFINEKIFNDLNRRLQIILRTEKQCVATGDTAFRPGFYVLEEIVRTIEKCEVIVLCISKSFCLSPWCKDEMLASQYQRKPVILMFLEEIDPSDMPKVLNVYFNNISRSKWVQTDHEWKLVPSWESVCASIIDLMNVEKK